MATLGCVWFRREIVKREVCKREYRKRFFEADEVILLGLQHFLVMLGTNRLILTLTFTSCFFIVLNPCFILTPRQYIANIVVLFQIEYSSFSFKV